MQRYGCYSRQTINQSIICIPTTETDPPLPALRPVSSGCDTSCSCRHSHRTSYGSASTCSISVSNTAVTCVWWLCVYVCGGGGGRCCGVGSGGVRILGLVSFFAFCELFCVFFCTTYRHKWEHLSIKKNGHALLCVYTLQKSGLGHLQCPPATVDAVQCWSLRAAVVSRMRVWLGVWVLDIHSYTRKCRHV